MRNTRGIKVDKKMDSLLILFQLSLSVWYTRVKTVPCCYQDPPYVSERNMLANLDSGFVDIYRNRLLSKLKK